MTSAERARKIRDILEAKDGKVPSERWSLIAAEIEAAVLEERQSIIHASYSEEERNQIKAEGFRAAQERAVEIVNNYTPSVGLSEAAWWSPNIVRILGEWIREMKP